VVCEKLSGAAPGNVRKNKDKKKNRNDAAPDSAKRIRAHQKFLG
jgi:hypothetical protein